MADAHTLGEVKWHGLLLDWIFNDLSLEKTSEESFEKLPTSIVMRHYLQFKIKLRQKEQAVGAEC